MNLLSATATADTAIFALQPPYGDAEVYRLAEAGEWERIGTDLRGIRSVHAPVSGSNGSATIDEVEDSAARLRPVT